MTASSLVSTTFLAGAEPDQDAMMPIVTKLRELGVLPTNAYLATDLDIGDEASNVRARLLEVVQAASQFIVIWNATAANSPRVNYQIGLADAFGKPITFVVSDEKRHPLPPILDSARIVELNRQSPPARSVTDATQLTAREVEVISLAADGFSNEEIALHLAIAKATVRTHMAAIYGKLNAHTREEVIGLARQLEAVRDQEIKRAETASRLKDLLLPNVAYRRFSKGNIIFHKGEPSRELYYVQAGTVVLDEIGVERGPGCIFGEMGVFSAAHQHNCTARCKTDVELLCLTSEQAKSLYPENHQFATDAIRLIWERLVRQSELSRSRSRQRR